MVNVNISNGEYLSEELMNEFERDYVENIMSVNEIKEKYGIGSSQYRKMRKEIVERTGYERIRRVSHENEKRIPKYYHYNIYSKKWTVRKSIGGKIRTLGSFAHENEAKVFVEKCKKVNWDLEEIGRMK